MTHLPRLHPPIWARLLAGFLILTAILVLAAVSFVGSPPKGPDQGECPVHEGGNPWCIR